MTSILEDLTTYAHVTSCACVIFLDSQHVSRSKDIDSSMLNRFIVSTSTRGLSLAGSQLIHTKIHTHIHNKWTPESRLFISGDLSLLLCCWPRPDDFVRRQVPPRVRVDILRPTIESGWMGGVQLAPKSQLGAKAEGRARALARAHVLCSRANRRHKTHSRGGRVDRGFYIFLYCNKTMRKIVEESVHSPPPDAFRAPLVRFLPGRYPRDGPILL